MEIFSITVGASFMGSCVSDCFSSFPVRDIDYSTPKGQNSSSSITVLLSCATFSNKTRAASPLPRFARGEDIYHALDNANLGVKGDFVSLRFILFLHVRGD